MTWNFGRFSWKLKFAWKVLATTCDRTFYFWSSLAKTKIFWCFLAEMLTQTNSFRLFLPIIRSQWIRKQCANVNKFVNNKQRTPLQPSFLKQIGAISQYLGGGGVTLRDFLNWPLGREKLSAWYTSWYRYGSVDLWTNGWRWPLTLTTVIKFSNRDRNREHHRQMS
jgi:hypothetical protein